MKSKYSVHGYEWGSSWHLYHVTLIAFLLCLQYETSRKNLTYFDFVKNHGY